MAGLNYVSLSGVSKTLNDTPLFENVTMGFHEGEKAGCLGPNGCGKSTFLKVVLKQLTADDGTIAWNSNISWDLLPQIPEFNEGETLHSFVYGSSHDNVKKLIEWQKGMGNDEDAYSALTEFLERHHVWDIPNRYQSYLTELGLSGDDRPMNTLSGGMIKKAAMARALSTEPDFLLLDEPTNHLDMESIEWLENYLENFRGAFLLITHDRYFLDRICNTIVEFQRGGIFKYPGNYSDYLAQREQRETQRQSEQNRIKTILRREIEWLHQGPKARASKDKKRIENAYNLMDRQESDDQQMAEFSSSDRRLGKKILDLKKVSLSYGDNKVINPFSYKFRKGERIGIVGPNGSGKTSFLNIVTRRQTPDTGSTDLGVNTQLAYFDQMSHPLQPNQTILGYMNEVAENIKRGGDKPLSVSVLLEQFLFTKERQKQTISRLSGGEKRRLYLIQILLSNPNFLILDEPTNDLDLDTIRKLEDYLINFPGCILMVSHDRAFLDRITDFMFIMDGKGNITGYAGNYSSYRQLKKEEITASKPEVKKEKPRKRAEKKGLSFKEKKELESLEKEIEEKEQIISDMEQKFSDPTLNSTDLPDLQKSYHKQQKTLEIMMNRWEELSAKEES